jgi:hypothetical protein
VRNIERRRSSVFPPRKPPAAAVKRPPVRRSTEHLLGRDKIPDAPTRRSNFLLRLNELSRFVLFFARLDRPASLG